MKDQGGTCPRILSVAASGWNFDCNYCCFCRAGRNGRRRWIRRWLERYLHCRIRLAAFARPPDGRGGATHRSAGGDGSTYRGRTSIMTIIRLLQQSAFEPEMIEILVSVFETARRSTMGQKPASAAYQARPRSSPSASSRWRSAANATRLGSRRTPWPICSAPMSEVSAWRLNRRSS